MDGYGTWIGMFWDECLRLRFVVCLVNGLDGWMDDVIMDVIECHLWCFFLYCIVFTPYLPVSQSICLATLYLCCVVTRSLVTECLVTSVTCVWFCWV